jgi:hypothetical protein
LATEHVAAGKPRLTPALCSRGYSLLVTEVPKLVEADLNPVRCSTGRGVVLDVRLCIERQGPVERIKTW